MTVKDLLFVYCYLIYESQSDQLLTALPQERADLVKKELKKFERFPKEVRLTLVLKLLGYLVQHVRNPHLEMIHPTWIAESLRKEYPHVIATILSQFSTEYRKQVQQALMLNTGMLPRPSTSVLAESVDVIFQIFCTRFASMGPPWGDPELSVDTMYLLKDEDLLTLIKQVGVREIARSFAIAGNDVLAVLLSRFPAELHEDFLRGVRAAKAESPEKQKTAAKRAGKYDLKSMPIEEATLRVGLTKIGSVLTKKSDVARKIAQRIPFELGMIILQADREETGIEDEEEEVMSTLRHLISRQKILFASPSGPVRVPDKDLVEGSD
ncbi:MAG TPA: hypothetical protein VLH08_19000 [Acidobacteriota bacterium]|nr:hypothetical protein [Acidobacteriota bacterium]